MARITTVRDFCEAIKMGENPILMSGWLLEMSVRNMQNPLRIFAVLPLSSIAGAFIAALFFLLFFFSKWILMLVGLYWLNDERLNLWPIFFFFVKAGAIMPPIVVGFHFIYSLIVMLAYGGGFAVLRKIRKMTFKDTPNGVVALG